MEWITRFLNGYKPVAFLLIVYWVMAITGARDKSNTFDEIPHMVGGYSYWKTGDFRLVPENGSLPQRWATMPLMITRPGFPVLNGTEWKTADLWNLGYQFFYRMENQPDLMLLYGRGMMALFGTALGLVIFAWSRQLFGPRGGLLSLTLYVFCPSFLAHGALVTTDVAVSLFLSLSVWLVWQLLHEIRASRILAASAALACLCLSKVSSLLILPMALLLLVARLSKGEPLRVRLVKQGEIEGWKAQLLICCGAIALPFLLSAVLIWSNYEFRYSAFRSSGGRFYRSWDEILPRAGIMAKGISWAKDKQLLPEAYLYGITYVLADRGSRRAFLNGQYSVKGWWYFLPYAFLVKTPIPSMALMILGLGMLIVGGTSFYRLTPIWCLIFVYGAFALGSSVNIAHRYLLPVYPALFVLAGATSLWFEKGGRVKVALVLLLLLWTVLESYRIRPHYLAYFNQFSGGPSRGYLHLVDSSLDWGQDLRGLKHWLDQNNVTEQKVFLSYFGTADPGYYGIEAVRLPANADQRRGEDKAAHWTGGIYCISATMLASVYSVAIGPWAAPYEAQYAGLLSLAEGKESPSGNALRDKDRDLLQKLQSARLCAFLRQRRPDGHVGYSILIYRLSDEQVRKALFGPPAELRDRIEVRGLSSKEAVSN